MATSKYQPVLNEEESLEMADMTTRENTDIVKSEKESCGYQFPKRFILALLTFTGWCVIYSLRSCLSIAIVAMASNVTENANLFDDLSYEQADFSWSPELQGVILSSFYYGYVLLQIPGGIFALKFGGQRVYSIAILLASVLTLLTPVLTQQSVYLLIMLRIMEGLCLGVNASSHHAIWSKWAPLYERTALITFSGTGSTVGSVLSLSITGLLAGSNAKWPSVFYFFGGIGVFWFVIFSLFAYESPNNHPSITEAEKEHIGEPWIQEKTKIIANIPWKKMFFSGPVWAILVASLCADWAFYTILICIPQYLKYLLKFNIEQTGFITALPYIACSIIHPLSGILADYLRRNHILSTTTVRKTFFTFGMLSSCTILISMGYTTNPHVAIVLLTASVGLQGTVGTGINVNHLDISPKYAGVLMGISNTIATFSGIFSPLVVGLITKHESADEWQHVFGISAGVSCLGVAFFLFLGSGDKQPWADN